MATHWTNSSETFALLLRRQGLDPDAVDDVTRAWSAFQEFVQTDIDGIEPAEDDGDGFSVQCGRWAWHDNRPALAFTRQFAVRDESDRDDGFGQTQLWSVELVLFFSDAPAGADLDATAWSTGMGFDFDPIGPQRAAALIRTAAVIATLPHVSAVWAAIPVGSSLRLERAD
ncbi:hypothetical protein [Streptacidiphilus jiangxiensis]|nr:hypothetical protein [Streptacidiphilus jiangxiensis]